MKMKMTILLEFSQLHEKVAVKLDDSQSPKTVKAIIERLPIRVAINRWGDELYTDDIGVKADEEIARSVVEVLDVAYWPEGNALCFFYGPTPISKQRKILPYSPVNIVGRIMTRPADLQEFLSSIEKDHINTKTPIVLC